MNLRSSLGQLKRALQGVWLNHWENPRLPLNAPAPRELGTSIEGRPLNAHPFGQGPSKILLVGGLHGNEIGGIKLAQRLISHFTQTPPPIRVWVIPCLNPDGHAIALQKPDYFGGGRHGRFNANGVDLNRNFPTKSFKFHSEWTHGKNYQERTPVNAGSHGGSEPETQALLEFIKKEGIELLVTFHTAGADVTGSRDPRSQQLSKDYARNAGYQWFSQVDWEALGHTGTPKEWCEENGVVFLEVEGSTRWGSDIKKQRPAIEALLSKLDGDYSE